MSLLAILLTIAVVGVFVWLILQAPMKPVFKNIIVGVAVIFILLWLLGQVGGPSLLQL